MNTNRYFFSNIIEDDSLSILAVEAKDLLQQNANIEKIFEVNNEILYGQSPRQVLFLMRQNNKSIFSSSPIKETIPSDAISYQGLPTTPVKRNPEISFMPRRNLSLGDAEIEPSHSRTLDHGSPARHRTVMVSHEDKAIANPVIDETAAGEEQFASPPGSTCSSKAGYKASPHSAEISKMTADLTMAEKELESPAEVVGNIGTSNQESPCSAEVTVMTARMTMDEKGLESPTKVVGIIDLENQESPKFAEITRMTSSLAMDKKSGNVVRDDERADNSATNTDIYEPGKKPWKPVSLLSTEGIIEMLKPSIVESEIPSPVKRSKICNMPTYGIQKSANPAEKSRIADSSPEYPSEIVSPIQSDKINISPLEASKVISSGERKRKSISPKKGKSLFRSIPRVVQSDVEAEVAIEVSEGFEDNLSPSTSRSSPADHKSDSTKGIKSPVVGGSKTNSPPSLLERYLRLSERAIPVGSYQNISGKNSPGSDDDAFAQKFPSSSSSITATTNKDWSLADIETDPVLLKRIILKFEMLLGLRNQFVQKTYCSLISLQTSIQFLISHINNIGHTVLKMGSPDKEYSTMQLRDAVSDVSGLALKLKNKFISWKADIDRDVDTWNRCLEKIQQLKVQYEPLLTIDGKPAVTAEVVQVYEYELKAIWKKIDDMTMMADSKRALFSHNAHDIEKLIKMFVKCLILVGILQTR